MNRINELIMPLGSLKGTRKLEKTFDQHDSLVELAFLQADGAGKG
jgi:hypothetical protein